MIARRIGTPNPSGVLTAVVGAQAAPGTAAENAENAGDSANFGTRESGEADRASAAVSKQLQRRLLDAEQELAHARQYAADA